MKIGKKDLKYIQDCIQDIKQEISTGKMKECIQHGDTTTYQHCELVTVCSYMFVKKLRLKVDKRSLVRGAFLHDYYLYDWHEKDASHKWHGYHHADKALENASRLFDLNELEKHIIYCHMWPLNISRIPRRKEAIIVCLVDKYCSTIEVFKKNNKKSN